MNYQEAVSYLENFPVFEPSKVKSGEQIMGLDSLRVLLKRLDNPEEKLRCIHVGGTNGKGSTVAFLRQILMEEGLSIGTFQSPAIDHMTEQIQLNGRDIEEEAFASILTRIRSEVDIMAEEKSGFPSPFEILVAAALLYFLEMKTDYVILEVGLGGDLDATNVIPTPRLAIITSISYDHMDLLGDTLAEIASHKAGIIKEGGEVIVYPQPEEVMEVLKRRATAVGARLVVSELPKEAKSYDLTGQVFDLNERWQNLKIGLLGTYQIRNAAVSLQAAQMLLSDCKEASIRRGLKNTRWPARFELIAKEPYMILDGGHNIQGIQVLRESLGRYFPGKKIHMVTGVLADKEYEKMMDELLPISERFYTITPPNPRALPAEKLAEHLRKRGADAFPYGNLKEAIEQARSDCRNQDDVICVFGSLYFVGLVKK